MSHWMWKALEWSPPPHLSQWGAIDNWKRERAPLPLLLLLSHFQNIIIPLSHFRVFRHIIRNLNNFCFYAPTDIFSGSLYFHRWLCRTVVVFENWWCWLYRFLGEAAKVWVLWSSHMWLRLIDEPPAHHNSLSTRNRTVSHTIWLTLNDELRNIERNWTTAHSNHV